MHDRIRLLAGPNEHDTELKRWKSPVSIGKKSEAVGSENADWGSSEDDQAMTFALWRALS